MIKSDFVVVWNPQYSIGLYQEWVGYVGLHILHITSILCNKYVLGIHQTIIEIFSVHCVFVIGNTHLHLCDWEMFNFAISCSVIVSAAHPLFPVAFVWRCGSQNKWFYKKCQLYYKLVFQQVIQGEIEIIKMIDMFS